MSAKPKYYISTWVKASLAIKAPIWAFLVAWIYVISKTAIWTTKISSFLSGAAAIKSLLSINSALLVVTSAVAVIYFL